EKPWGTAHAVWAARHAVQTPFLAVNADDFYGREAFAAMGDFLRDEANAGSSCALVAYALRNTLSENGTVSRGICSRGESGGLVEVEECVEIGPGEDGVLRGNNLEGQTREFEGGELVSMNFWGFSPDVFDRIGEMFATFLDGLTPERPKAEFYIPTVVTELIEEDGVDVAVLESDSRWFGVTYREDRAGVVAALAALVDAGDYPSPLA
ncbi:MAG: hypothetical protein WA771_02815, partial [Chthoniobacterales bacterium]